MLMHVQRLCIFSENQSADVSNEKETERCEWVVLYLCQLSTALRNVNSKTANSTSNNDFNIVWKVCTQGTLERAVSRFSTIRRWNDHWNEHQKCWIELSDIQRISFDSFVVFICCCFRKMASNSLISWIYPRGKKQKPRNLAVDSEQQITRAFHICFSTVSASCTMECMHLTYSFSIILPTFFCVCASSSRWRFCSYLMEQNVRMKKEFGKNHTILSYDKIVQR